LTTLLDDLRTWRRCNHPLVVGPVFVLRFLIFRSVRFHSYPSHISVCWSSDRSATNLLHFRCYCNSSTADGLTPTVSRGGLFRLAIHSVCGSAESGLELFSIMSKARYLSEHDSSLAVPLPPRSSSRSSVRSDLCLDKPLPPIRRISSEINIRNERHLTALPDRAPTPAFSQRPSRLQSRPSKMSLFNLFNKPKVEKLRGYAEPGLSVPPWQKAIHESSAQRSRSKQGEASPDHEWHNGRGEETRRTKLRPSSPIGSRLQPADSPEAQSTWSPPPLTAVYSQAIKAAIAHTSSADESARPHTPFRSHTSSPQDVQSNREAGGPRRLSILYPQSNISIERKVFALVPGHLLQYTERGSNDRLPERSLQLTKDSVAIASDLVPGKPYTIQITQATTIQTATDVSLSASLMAKFKFRGSSPSTKTPSILIINDNSKELEDWLHALRSEIMTLGGHMDFSKAVHLQKQNRDRSDSLKPSSAGRRASADASSTVNRPRSRRASRADPVLHYQETIPASPRSPVHRILTNSPAQRSLGIEYPVDHSESPTSSPRRLPLDRLRSEPVSPARVHRKAVAGTTKTRRASVNGGSSPQSSMESSSLPPSPAVAKQSGPDFVVPISRFSADSAIEITSRRKSAVREQTAQPQAQLRASSSFSSIRSVRSILPPTIREVPTPASPTLPGQASQPPMRQLHSRRVSPLPIKTNGKTLHRSSSQTTLQDSRVTEKPVRRHSHSLSDEKSEMIKESGVPAQTEPIDVESPQSRASGDNKTRPILRKQSSKLSLFPSPPASSPTLSSPLTGLSLNEIASRSNRPALKRPASFQVRPRLAPITPDLRSVTSSDIHAPIGLGIEISLGEANCINGSLTSASVSRADMSTNDRLSTDTKGTAPGLSSPRTSNESTLRASTPPDAILSLPKLDLGLPVVGLGPPAPPPMAPLPEIPQSRPHTPQPTN